MHILKIAFRNIFRRKRRSIFSGVAIAVGLILVSVSLGFSEGGYYRIVDMITADSVGHMQIHKEGYLDNPTLYKTISNYSKLETKLKGSEGVKSFAPRVRSGALAFHGKKTLGISIMGIVPKREKDTTRIMNKLVKGRFFKAGKNEAVITQTVAKILKLDLGGEVVLISQGADGSIANDLFKITGIIKAKNGTLNPNLILLPLEDAQIFLALHGRIHEIVVILDSLDNARMIAGNLQIELGDKLEVDPWQVVREDFYKAMLADKNGNYLFLFIIVFVVATVVFNTILMNIIERAREYGLLRSIGTRPFDIFSLIISESVILTLMSSVPGLILAYFANYLLVEYGFTLPDPVEYGGVTISEMRSIMQFESFWIPLLIIIGTSIIVGVYPGIKAAKISPSKAMRDY